MKIRKSVIMAKSVILSVEGGRHQRRMTDGAENALPPLESRALALAVHLSRVFLHSDAMTRLPTAPPPNPLPHRFDSISHGVEVYRR